MLSNYIHTLALFYSFGMIFLAIIKTFKSGSNTLSRYLTMDDYYSFLLVSILASIPIASNIWTLQLITYLVISALFIILWLDAIIFELYSIEINPSSIKIFLSGAGAITQSGGDFFSLAFSKLRIPLLLIGILIYYLCICFHLTKELNIIFPALVLFAIFCLSKSRIKMPLGIIWPLSLILVEWLWLSYGNQILTVLNNNSFDAGLYTIATLILLTKHLSVKQQTPFFSFPSTIRKLITYRPIKFDPSIQIKAQDTHIIQPKLTDQKPSTLFNATPDANIILVTVESLAASYLSEISDLPNLTQLAKQATQSKSHYCISPNTDNAFRLMYSGDYSTNVQQSYLTTLHQADYQSVFFTSQDMDSFHLGNLLKKIGFQSIFSLETFCKENQSKPIYNDYITFEKMKPLLIQQLKQKPKFLLHILNNNTHHPYTLKNKGNLTNNKQRYLQAIKESDELIFKFINDIISDLNLTNTIIIFTGDHGQAFGQYGYKVHSNAIINEEIQVPFYLHHPKLPQQSVDFSSHFDIFPTVLDLLGLHYDFQSIGSSIYSHDRSLNYFLFSETRNGKLPSSFGFINNNEKILFDTIYHYYYQMDRDDTIKQNLTTEQRGYYSQLLYQALQQRGLIE